MVERTGEDIPAETVERVVEGAAVLESEARTRLEDDIVDHVLRVAADADVTAQNRPCTLEYFGALFPPPLPPLALFFR